MIVSLDRMFILYPTSLQSYVYRHYTIRDYLLHDVKNWYWSVNSSPTVVVVMASIISDVSDAFCSLFR